MLMLLSYAAFAAIMGCTYMLTLPADQYRWCYVGGIVVSAIVMYCVMLIHRSKADEKRRASQEAREFADVAEHLREAAECISRLEKQGHKMDAVQQQTKVLRERLDALQAGDVGFVAKRTAVLVAVGRLESSFDAFRDAEGEDFDVEPIGDRLQELVERTQAFERMPDQLAGLKERTEALKARLPTMLAGGSALVADLRELNETLFDERSGSLLDTLDDLEKGDSRENGDIADQVDAIERQIKEVNERLVVIVEASEKLPALKTQAEQLAQRVKPLKDVDDGIVAVVESVNNELDELLNKDEDEGSVAEMLKGSDEFDDDVELPEQVKALQKRARTISARLDEIDALTPHVKELQDMTARMTVQAKTLADDKDGIVELMRQLNKALDALYIEGHSYSGDEGILATIEQGDDDSEDVLKEQLEEARRRVREIGGKLKELAREGKITADALVQL